MLKNAARPGTCMPLTGLGVDSYGCKMGAKSDCWHFGTKEKPGPCCTKDWCPIVNSTRDWLKMGGARIDAGYPYGDNACNWPVGIKRQGACGNKPFHDMVGVGLGMAQSGLKREDVFVTARAGTHGPMAQYELKQDVYITNEIEGGWPGFNYIDLMLMHYADMGGKEKKPAPGKIMYHCGQTRAECRIVSYSTLVAHYQSGLVKAIGVSNWDADEIEHLRVQGPPFFKKHYSCTLA